MASAPGDAPAADAASPVALASDAVSEDGDAARRGCGGALRCAANALYRHRGKPNEVFGWYFHAAARAPFLFAVAAFLAPYLTALAQFEQAADGRVSWLGLRLLPSSFVAVFTTVANLLMALVMPLLGTAADFTAYRKLLLAGFNTVGALCGVSV
jgi:UMF1 family MFS transporter